MSMKRHVSPLDSPKVLPSAKRCRLDGLVDEDCVRYLDNTCVYTSMMVGGDDDEPGPGLLVAEEKDDVFKVLGFQGEGRPAQELPLEWQWMLACCPGTVTRVKLMNYHNFDGFKRVLWEMVLSGHRLPVYCLYPCMAVLLHDWLKSMVDKYNDSEQDEPGVLMRPIVLRQALPAVFNADQIVDYMQRNNIYVVLYSDSMSPMAMAVLHPYWTMAAMVFYCADKPYYCSICKEAVTTKSGVWLHKWVLHRKK